MITIIRIIIVMMIIIIMNYGGSRGARASPGDPRELPKGARELRYKLLGEKRALDNC